MLNFKEQWAIYIMIKGTQINETDAQFWLRKGVETYPQLQLKSGNFSIFYWY